MNQRASRMRLLLPLPLVAAVLSVALGCATSGTPDVAAQPPPAAERHAELERPRTEPLTLRLGFWEIDFLALDLEPRGTTFRLLDFKILKVLEVGWGADYHSVSLVEMPDLLNGLTTRHEGPSYEHRLADVQMLALAPLRVVKTSARESEAHLLKVPVVGSLFGREIDGSEKKYGVLYLFRWETER